MVPAHPPLPIIWNLLFQLSAGSQSSILISESADGLSVAATRQCAGSITGAWVPRPPPAPRPAACAGAPAAGVAGAAPLDGGATGPAGTNSTVVNTASAGCRAFSFSHDEESRATAEATPPNANRNVRVFMNRTPLGHLATEIHGVVGRAGAFVNRYLRIGAQRTRHVDIVTGDM